jgi:hypothetical protein
VPGAAWALVGIFLAIMILRDPRGKGWLATIVVLTAVIGGPTVLKRLNTRVIITKDLVVFRNSLRRSQQCKRSELTRSVVVRVQLLGPRLALTRVLMLDRGGRVCASVQVDAWSDSQLAMIYDRLGLPVLEHPTPLSPWKANKEFPGATSAVLRYWPILAGTAVLGSFIVIGSVVAVFGK